MNVSRKHHYIPQFYLRGFTNDAGTFYIYDKTTDRLKKGEFSTASHFFEFDRNTIVVNGEPTDFIEKLYQKHEDKAKKIFAELRKATGHISLDANKVFDLQLFALFTYWRIPTSDGKLNKLLNSSNLGDYGLRIMNSQTNRSIPSEKIEEYLSTPGFVEALRTIFPILQFTRSRDNEDIENWEIYYSSGEGIHITGDNPIIVREVENDDLLSNELIIRLTKRQVLIRSKNKFTTKTLSAAFTLKLDLLIYLQSSKYICGTNANYLNSLSQLSKNGEQSENELRVSLFEYLDKECPE